MSSRQSFVDAVRVELRDYPELNELLLAQEHSDQDIEFALGSTLDDINQTEPTSSYTYGNIPDKRLLIQGAIAHLYTTIMRLLARGVLRGSEVGVEHQLEAYRVLEQQAKAEYMARMQGLKVRSFNSALMGSYVEQDGWPYDNPEWDP